VLNSVRGVVDPRAIVQLERLGQLKSPMKSEIEPSCSIMPLRTTLPRAEIYSDFYKYSLLLKLCQRSFIVTFDCIDLIILCLRCGHVIVTSHFEVGQECVQNDTFWNWYSLISISDFEIRVTPLYVYKLKEP
jgi:hypothetical protein